MLDLGFLPDVEKLLALTPASRQTMLFSATMPGAVVALARRYMTQPTHIRAMGEAQDGHTVKAVEQFVYRAHAMDKVEMLARMLQAEGRGLTIIFSRTKRTAAKVADELADRGFAAAAIHGDLGQGAREQALRAFRNGKVDILVATDVAARGIDVENVTHVVNYQCPEDEKTYLHRIGRTARAGNTGVAVTFVDWDDMPRWGLINKTLDLGIPDPQETYSSSEHLFTQLDIPRGGHRAGCPRPTRPAPGLAAEQVEDLGETGKSSGRGTARGAAPAGALARAGRRPAAAPTAPRGGPPRAGPARAGRAQESDRPAGAPAAAAARRRRGQRRALREPTATSRGAAQPPPDPWWPSRGRRQRLSRRRDAEAGCRGIRAAAAPGRVPRPRPAVLRAPSEPVEQRGGDVPVGLGALGAARGRQDRAADRRGLGEPHGLGDRRLEHRQP